MTANIWRLLYTTLFFIALPIIYLRLLWRSKRLPAYRQRMKERLGQFELPEKFSQGIWVHAVSFGETIVATPLVKKLQEQYPNLPVVMTSMTPTGAAQAKKTFGDSIFHVYMPYDLPVLVNRFLNKVQPKLAIFIETELWPNILFALKQKNIPSILANARLSEKSFNGYARFKTFVGSALQCLTLVAAQAEADAKRFDDLGVDKESLKITGNIKFDIKAPDDLPEKTKALRAQLGEDRLVWIAGSTHAGEEEQVLAAFSEIKKQFPKALLLLVPRHPDRFNEVIELCKSQGYQVRLRSEDKAYEAGADIFLGDSMGEMLLFYSVSDVAFVGGSLIESGGHNMLEPALFALPVIVGPSVFNFAQVYAFLTQAKALVTVKDSQALAGAVTDFFTHPEKRQQYGAAAKQVVENNRGALEKHLGIINGFLEAPLIAI